MALIFIDIETIETQNQQIAASVMESAKLTAPSLTKPKLIDELGLGDQGKYKTVDELKEIWIERNAEKAKLDVLSKTALNGDYGEIVSIAWGSSLDDIDCVYRSDGDEAGLISSFWQSLGASLHDSREKVTFVAHNKAFDLPFLWKRSVINQANPGIKFDPYSRDHICTMELWNGFKGMIKLSKLASILDVGGKTGEGCQVAEWWKAGKYDQIAEYNKDDADLLIKVYNKLTFK